MKYDEKARISQSNQATIDWASNWIRRVNDDNDDLFCDRLDNDTLDKSLLWGLLISMITRNQ